jgi:uncharacterized protein YkwD
VAGLGPTVATVELGDLSDALSVEGDVVLKAGGGEGDDALTGGAQADTIDGGGGNDNVNGGGGNDTVQGGSGNDSLLGGAGKDSFKGGDGDDTLDSSDGEADDLECGAGIDQTRSDAFDRLAADCERLETEVGGGSTPPGGTPPGTTPPPAPNPGAPGGSGPPLLAPSKACKNADARPRSVPVRALEKATTCLINAERKARGLRRLRVNSRLSLAARRLAFDMVRHRYFAHVTPTGRSVVDRLKASGYLGSQPRWAVGEALAWGSGSRSTPRNRVRAWLKSPDHRPILLSKRYREIGVGMAAGAPKRGVKGAGTYAADFGVRGR